MEVIIKDSAAELATVAADIVQRLVHRKADAVLGVATGSSPVGLYDELGRRVAAGTLSLAGCQAFMLDEYVGLAADHPQRYRNVIETELVARTDIRSERVHGPDGLASDIPAACAAYEQAIRDAGGVDLQVLGIGTDGHIAFNEPTSSLGSRTRIKTLARQTRIDNARFFDDEAQVPTHCLTQGVGTILEARRIVLLAEGEQKAEAIRQLVEGPVSAMWTATALQWHPYVTVIVDQAAASRLALHDYYLDVYAQRPGWQE
ncbi:glucosamine-6-phosphate deaminase [Raineyella fluvialis]|uniref:Glucosamine-6-phosphate deaminase n=1 Tax=Raineyella fluvialis TaxID=2662261 RepID=A0A5Q2FDD5_9ACTN|nr:glucosamine-6-phosphate deaminase [Raineyella fluvialis]QGF23444.1 glucosamine-6-phosphate deaminase [Raineyella fluvialis]